MSAAHRPTALVMHPDCARHDNGWRHPEHQGRLPAIVQALYRDTPDLLERVLQREGTPASVEQVATVHNLSYIERVRSTVAEAERRQAVAGLGPDTNVSAASWDAAVAAVGCVLDAAALVLGGEAESAFALTRPPGHHALPDRAMGFCIFNNVAIAARELQRRHGVERVLIVDWDVHHGNGTQDIFYADPTVYSLSLHQSPHYPGTGAADERGAGAGAGHTLNVPLAAGTSRAAYLAAYRSALDQAFSECRPQFVLVSAGFDCMAGDPLGGLLLEPADLHRMASELLELGRAAGVRGLALVLEGGYDPPRTGQAVVEVLRALAGLPPGR